MSTIYNIRTLLEHTIENKERHFADLLAEYLACQDKAETVVLNATMKFLKINIDELKAIQEDVVKACEEHNRMSWELNPERMGQ